MHSYNGNDVNFIIGLKYFQIKSGFNSRQQSIPFLN